MNQEDDLPALDALGPRLEAAFHAALPRTRAPADAAFVAGLVDRHGEQRMWAHGCDAARALFPLGSVTKLFVATATAAWMDEHPEVTLDTPLARLWPAGTRPAPEDEQVTLGHLLSHRAGYDYSDLGLARGAREAAPAPALAALPGTLVREPGHCVSYSNLGVARLGRLLERNDGEPIGALLGRRVWSPLGMQATRIALDDSDCRDVPVARDRAGRAAPLLLIHPDYRAAGAALAPMPDMLRFGCWLLQVAQGRGAPVLTADSARRLLAPIVQFGPLGELQQAMLFTGFRSGGTQVWGHTGGWPGHRALLLVFPRLGVALFAAAVVTDDLPCPSDQLWGALAQSLLGAGVAPADTRKAAAVLPRPGVYVSSKLPLAHAERALALLAGSGCSRVRHLADGLHIGHQGPFVALTGAGLTLRDAPGRGLSDLLVVGGRHDGRDAYMRSAQRELHVRSRLAGVAQPLTRQWPGLTLFLATAPLAWFWPGGRGPAQVVVAVLMTAACASVWHIGRDPQSGLRVLSGDRAPLRWLRASAWLAAAAAAALWLMWATAPAVMPEDAAASLLLRGHQALYTGAATLALLVLTWLGLPVPFAAAVARRPPRSAT